MKSVVLRAIDAVTRATKWVTIFATVCIAIMMVIITIDIVGSKWFKWSLPGTLDFSEELMVLLTLLPVAYVALERGHIRITFLEERMPQAGRFSLQLLRYTVGMLIMGFLSWRTFTQFQYVLKTMQVKEGINFPIWPANLAVVLSFGFLALVYLLLLAKTLTAGAEK
jgi:TRAP-type C4-dicarboxylate transport system permease small subunit